jgi:VWFA-related protein
MTRPASVLLVFVLAAAVRAQPQQPQESQPTPTFRARVSLVRVDVSVIGRGDSVVADLQPGDFEIEEDGIPQKIETLQFVRLDGTRTAGRDESLPIRSPEHARVEAARDDVRVFALFLDDYHVDKKPEITIPLRRALKHLVDQFGPNDLIAVMDPLTPLSHLEFTRAREDLLRRVGEFEGRRGEVFPVKSPIEEAQLSRPNLLETRAGVTLTALESLVTHLGGLREGRKSVLFVSQGPPLGPVGNPNHDRLADVLRAANRGNVTVHVLDPRPLGSGPPGGEDSLFRLYHETGGRAILNSNDYRPLVGRIIDDASAYYLIGYSPSRDASDGKFHRIDVRVRRRGVRVIARRGYWAPTAKEMTPEPVSAPAEPGLVEALTDLVEPKDGRSASVWIGASKASNGMTTISMSWEPSERTEGAPPARLVIAPIRDGGVADGARSVAPVSAAEDERTAAFDVKAGTMAEWRFTVLAPDGEVVDQWRERLQIPDLSGPPVALSTPRFLRARSAFEARALDGGVAPPPAASRQFRKTDRVVVEVEWYAEREPALTAQLLNGRGDRLSELNVSRRENGRARVLLPLSSMAAGTYLLRLQARSGDHETYQRCAFRVVP